MTRPSRVLMTTDTVGGVWTYTLALCRAFAERGITVDLAAMGGHPSVEQRAEAATLPTTTLHARPYKLEWMDDPWEDVRRAGDWLQELAARTSPDLVHVNQFAFGALPWTPPALVVGHSCVCSWWRAVHGTDAPASWNRYREVVRAGLAGADLVVAPTRWMMQALDEHYGPLHRTRVILNGRDPVRFRAAERRDPIVLAVGRLWDEAKNIALLGRAAPRLPWPVLIAGDERHPNGSVADIANVCALGQLGEEELADWLARAAIYALPARYEPFGLSALEAALSGCALVLGDIPSLRELWDGAAVFVSPADADALATAIEALVADPARRRTLAEAARRRGHRLTRERMAAGYLEAYDELLTRARGARSMEAVACAS